MTGREVDDATAQNTGTTIRKLYRQKKRQYSKGKRYSEGKRWNMENTWIRAGRLCCQLRVSPVQFVDSAWLANTVPGGPYPNQLSSEKYMRAAVQRHVDPESANNLRKEILNEMEFKRKVIIQALMKRRDWIHDLDQVPGLSVVNIVLMNSSEEVLRKYRAHARRELGANPELAPVLEMEFGLTQELKNRILSDD